MFGVKLRADSAGFPVNDVLFVATPGSASNSAIHALGDADRPSEMIVDLGTASLADKQASLDNSIRIGARFVDAAIIGPVGVYGLKTAILASGVAATEFKRLGEPLGMCIDAIEGPVGAAAAAKQVRSIFTKGFGSLVIETDAAAKSLGVDEVVMNSLSDTFDNDSLVNHFSRYIRETSVHAGRRHGEMSNVAEFLSTHGLPHGMTRATVETLEWTESSDSGIDSAV